MSEPEPPRPSSPASWPGPVKGRSAVVLCLVLGAAAAVWWVWARVRPTVYAPPTAAERLEMADRQAEEGDFPLAAHVYAEVASAGGEHAPDALGRLRRLLDGPVKRLPLSEAAPVLRAAARNTETADVATVLFDRGLQLVRDKGEADARAALAVLDLIGPFAPHPEEFNQECAALLGAWVAKRPGDIELVTGLALVYERQRDAERCFRLLAPLADKIGAGEAARVFGQLLYLQGKYDEARKFLTAYVEKRKPELETLEAAHADVYPKAHTDLMARIESRTAPGIPYEDWDRADAVERLALERRYVQAHLDAIPRVREVEVPLKRFAEACHHLAEVHRARAGLAPGPEGRRAELIRADEALLSAGAWANDRDEFRLARAQLALLLGRHEEAKRIVNHLLADRGRAVDSLVDVADALRAIGQALPSARSLAEEAYEKEKDARKKYRVAVLRAEVAEEADDLLTWLARGDPNDVGVQARLAQARGLEARDKGQFEEAARLLRESLASFARLPRRAEVLQHEGRTALALFALSGDEADLTRGVALMDQALAQAPHDGLLLARAVEAVSEAALRKVLAAALDLKGRQVNVKPSLLGFLYRDRAGRDALLAKVRDDPHVTWATVRGERLIEVMPRHWRVLDHLAAVAVATRDLAALRKLDEHLRKTEPDLDDANRRLLDYYAGARDAEVRAELAGNVRRWEVEYERLRGGRRGPTFAVAAATLANYLAEYATLGEGVDADRVVRLAEEAHAAAPSEKTAGQLANALLLRAHRRAARAAPEYVRVTERGQRTLTPGYLVVVALSRGGKPAALLAADADVRRAGSLVAELVAALPDGAGPWGHLLLRATHPKEADRVAEAVRKDEFGTLARAVMLKLSPANVATALENYWALRLAGKEVEAREVMRRCAALGAPMPFDLD